MKSLPKASKSESFQRAWEWDNLEPRLRASSLPAWWICWVIEAATRAAGLAVVCGLEVFSGTGNLSTAFAGMVGPVLTLELLDDSTCNILHVNGLRKLLIKLMRVMRCGWLWLGTPCKSWVALSRSFSRRSMLIPEGPPASATSARQRLYLDEHNGIAQLTALLFETACLLSIHPVIEQPQSSLLFHYKPVESVLNKFEAMHIAFQMAAFGGSSPKPLIIRGVGRFFAGVQGCIHSAEGNSIHNYSAIDNAQREGFHRPPQRSHTIKFLHQNLWNCYGSLLQRVICT